MGKFNKAGTKPARGKSPIKGTGVTTKTFEGGQAFTRDPKGDLFLLAVSNFVGEDTFYEKADARDERYRQLVRAVATTDPEWVTDFFPWLRGPEANMRSASLVGALEAAKVMVEANIPGSRGMIAETLSRPDEPGEAVAYWTSRYGKAMPMPVKRGIADGAKRLYNEFALLKYDTDSKGVRFADVIDLTHPSPATDQQSDLFRFALDRRHGRASEVPESLPVVQANQALRQAVLANEANAGLFLRPSYLAEAGMTWEDALSLAGSKVDKAKLWEALIPTMGYMALLRNLRNFDEAGVSDETAAVVIKRLTDPEQVAKSRQFPYRFLAAYENVPSDRWRYPLSVALDLSLANIPHLEGKNLVLIDTSASMTMARFSKKSTMTAAKAAAVFGVALAKRSGADLYGFATGRFRHQVLKGSNVLAEVNRFVGRTGEVGHGTEMAAAIHHTFQRHDRIFLISDMQAIPSHGGVSTAVPPGVPIYAFNLGGYGPTVVDTTKPNRIEFGGLTDATFKMIPLIEAGKNADWPWV